MSGSVANYKLPTTVTISECDELLKKFNHIVSDNESVELDISELESIDTAGIQLIISMYCELHKKGDVKKYLSQNENLKEVIARIGLKQ